MDNLRRSSRRRRNGVNSAVISSNSLPKAILCLKRLTQEEISKYTSKSKPSSKTTKVNKPSLTATNKTATTTKNKQVNKSSSTAKKTKQFEIKLDSLKASEIETLISDLLKNPNQFSSPVANSPQEGPFAYPNSIRKSSRKPKPKIPYQPDAYHHNNEEDAELSQSDHNDADEDYEGPKEIKKPRKKSKAPKSALEKLISVCRVCDLKLESRDEYIVHMESVHLTPSDGYICPICNTGYYPLTKFTNHMRHHKYLAENRVVRPERTIPCKYCPMKFESQSRLELHDKKHEKSMNSDKPFECPTCHHRFAQRHNLKRHFTLHLQNNPYECKFVGCGKKFNSEHNLRRHGALHMSRVTFNCPHCPASYTYKYKWKRHIERYHSNGDATKEGNKLGMRPQVIRKRKYQIQNINDLPPEEQIKALEAHKAILSIGKLGPNSESEIKVDVKGESIPEESNRFELDSIHLDEHANVTVEQISAPHENTNEGGKEVDRSHLLFDAFRSDPVILKMQEENPEGAKQILSAPYNLNTRRKEFSCKSCNWACSKVYLLKQHMKKVHNQSLPLLRGGINMICASCGYQSNSSSDLSTHMLTAHKECRKFGCSFCTHRFGTKERKDSHERRIHLSNGKLFSCSKCTRKYTQKRFLARHLKEKHEPGYKKVMEEELRCELCSKVLKTKRSYEHHLTLHTDQRELTKCLICGQSCSGKLSLRRHIQYVHLGAPNPWNLRNKLRKDQEAKAKKSGQREAENSTKNQRDDQVGDNKGDLSILGF